MTAKRFKEQNLENHLNRIYDAKKGKVVFDEDIVDLLNDLNNENEQLKQQLFETSKELLWATSDEVDRALHYEDEVEELRKEIFE